MGFFKVQLYLPSISKQLCFHSLVREHRAGKWFASMPVWGSSVAPDSVLLTVASSSSLVSVLGTFVQKLLCLLLYCVSSSFS